MLLILASALLQAVVAVSFPPPTGPYQVGYTQHVFPRTTLNDPVNPPNRSSILLATIYYPTLTIASPGINIAPYLDAVTAKIWSDNYQFPENSLQNLTTWNVYQAAPLNTPRNSESQKPTIIFSPGAGENAIMYNALISQLASAGYTIVALDHAGEAPFLHLPDGRPGIYGLDINYPWNETLAESVVQMRVSDILATVRNLFPAYVASTGAPFNTTHYFALGHSLGGTAAAYALGIEPSILGAVNMDGTYFTFPNVKKPLLMLGQEAHTLVAEPSWPAFVANQSGWWEWLVVAGSKHQNFADLGDWVDLLGLRNRTAPMGSLGTVWAPRMDYIVKTLVETFYRSVLRNEEWLEVPKTRFPEVERVGGSVR
ncbi:paf acetylhydrolase family protein [Stagonosporopsis vannaccii]|nr:paf acetylhydrolase family protein [Stagonosporopsis vannaccii]